MILHALGAFLVIVGGFGIGWTGRLSTILWYFVAVVGFNLIG